MKVVVARSVDYVPEWGDNKQLPEADQLVVSLKYPTVEERKRYVSAQQRFHTSGRDDAEGSFSVDVNVNYEALVDKYVTGVRNLTIGTEDGDEEIHVTTGKQMLSQPGLHDLVQEIGLEISRMRARASGVDPRLRSDSGAGSEGTQSTDRDPAGAR